MPCSRFVLRLIAHAEACGAREEMIGDLLEELAHDRSPAWLCRQLLAACGWALVARARHHWRMTPQRIALLLGLTLLASVSLVPVGRVLQAWLVVYYASGTLSLFAHMVSGVAVGLRGFSTDRAAASD